MTKRERVETTYQLLRPDRPPFVPAIYEHKAALIGETPSVVCRDPERLHASLLRELAVYDPDMLVVGIDVYNVEAEALGCKVVWFEDSSDVPAVCEPLLDRPADMDRLGLPDPEHDGRMPLFLDVAAALQREVGANMIVRGAVTGPFSLASELLGAENLLVAAIEYPGFTRNLLEFAAGVTASFGSAFARRGVEPILFDSRATPMLASPRVFRSLILPVYRDLVMPRLRAAGARYVPLIIGGNTDSILEDLVATGASQLLCDAGSSLARFRDKCLAARLPFRASVDARLVSSGPADAIRRESLRVLEECRDHPGFLFGCGVVAYDCVPEHVLAMRRALEDAAAGTVN
jgi:uroporphyrinogen decarboxylase